MRFGLGTVHQISNTFAKDSTTIDDFSSHTLLSGVDVFQRFNGTGTTLGRLIDYCEHSGYTPVPLIAAQAPAGGPIDSECLERLVGMLLDATREAGELDGMILKLSGTTVATKAPAADAVIVGGIRDAFQGLPIALILDPWANLCPELVDLAEVIVSSPLDPREVQGSPESAAIDLLARQTRGDLSLKRSHRKLPMIVPTAALRSDVPPLDLFFEQVRNIANEAPESPLSVFGGFQQADVAHAGVSIYGVSPDVNIDQHVNALTESLLSCRNEIRIPARNPEEAIHDAMARREGSSLIVDLGDDPGKGGPGDGTTLLWALIDLGVRDAVLASIVDPTAVNTCLRAGPNARVEIPLGGNLDTRHGYPIDVSGRVRTISDGRFRLTGPIDTGIVVDAGSTVVLTVEARHGVAVDVVVTERPVESFDPVILTALGLDPTSRRIVAIKSSSNYIPAFEPLVTAIHLVLTPGITTPDPAFYDYQNIARPMFPVDPL